MRSKKILVIIPDGVGLRNFVYTKFPEEAKKVGWELLFLNMTHFDLKGMGHSEMKLDPRPSVWTDLLKRAKILIELDLFKSKFDDPVYEKYKFPASSKGFKNKLKNFILSILIRRYNSESGLVKLRRKMKDAERKTGYYNTCLEILKRENPDVVFCTNQRPVNAISPITAAQDLGISTSCFIFSWDNLPKATKVLDTDYYFVWSEYMKMELLQYYPDIKADQIKITGTPQFEIHNDRAVVLNKEEFFNNNGLDKEKKYLCFSGDDITTSPHDEYFLKDVAEEVEKLNQKEHKLGIIFRRCPVDFSQRYDKILQDHKGLIVPIDPEWTGGGDYWNHAIPTKEDLHLQTNIIEHSFMVINVGSSMVFDYAAKGKPCAYLNYLPPLTNLEKDIKEVYSYTHFKSMPDENSVYWINKKSDISLIVESALRDPHAVVSNAQDWFNIINSNSSDSTVQIINELDKLLK